MKIIYSRSVVYAAQARILSSYRLLVCGERSPIQSAGTAFSPAQYVQESLAMEQTKIDDLESKLELATQALRISEGRATAGRLALEAMHDIRNPLDALNNLTYLILGNPEDSEKVRLYAGQAQEQIGNAIEIANSTLGFAQASNQPKPTNLVLLAEAALRIHQR